jgi:hypothetical protein
MCCQSAGTNQPDDTGLANAKPCRGLVQHQLATVCALTYTVDGYTMV